MADIVTLDQVLAALNLESTSGADLVELELYISAVSEHVAEHYGEMPSGTYTETAPAFYQDGTLRLLLSHQPVLTVTSIARNGTTYTTDLTVTPAGHVTHDSLAVGDWTVVYTAGFASVPADLQLAALEDIRGIYQPGQIGPPAQFGAFGIDSTEVGPAYRPVRLWPRVDAWIERRTIPGVA